jgi:PAS domain S-box-containing protein
VPSSRRFLRSRLREANRETTAESGFSLHLGGKDSPSPVSQRLTQSAHYLLQLTVVLAAYFLAGKLGLAVPFTSGNISPVWPAAGVAVAALWVAGYRVWPAIALGAFLVNFFTPIPHSAALGIALGNTAGPVIGVCSLRRLAGFHPSLSRVRDVVGLIVLAALGGTAISATIGAGVLFFNGVNAWAHFGVAWLMWWLGDALGVLIVAPLVLAWPRLVAMRRDRHVLELGSLLLGTAVACIVIFDSRVRFHLGGDVLVLGLVPFVLWGATRFEVAGAAAVNCLIAGMAVWEAAHRLGPFVRSSPVESATLMQAFLGLIAATGIVLAAAVDQRAQTIREQTAREALQQSERQFEGLVETANEGIWILDEQFATRSVNRRMAELLGYCLKDMLHKPLCEFVFPEDREKQEAELNRHEQREKRYRKKDGSELWARVSTAPIFDQDGRFAGAVEWFSDLTDQRRSEADRRSAVETAMLLSRAVEQTADSILITDKTGLITYVNPAFEAITGFSRDEALGKTPRIIKSGEQGPDFYQKLWECISEGQPFKGTLVNRKKSGERYWAEESITPIRDEEGKITHFVSVIKDVTEIRKKQEQEMQLRLAREVQQRFYNSAMSAPGVEVAAAAYPADETGGDYFDFILLPDNSFYVAIGDVSGHGLSSALVMALTRAYVRSFAELQLDVGEILMRVNRMLRADLDQDRYVTVLLVRVEPPRNSLTYASAGHVPGVVFNDKGETNYLLDSTGPPLGLFAQLELSTAEIALKPGQTLLLTTDGVAETCTCDDVTFGWERLLEYMRSNRDASACEIVHGMYRAVRTFAGNEPQHDDVTSIVLKVTA